MSVQNAEQLKDEYLDSDNDPDDKIFNRIKGRKDKKKKKGKCTIF